MNCYSKRKRTEFAGLLFAYLIGKLNSMPSNLVQTGNCTENCTAAHFWCIIRGSQLVLRLSAPLVRFRLTIGYAKLAKESGVTKQSFCRRCQLRPLFIFAIIDLRSEKNTKVLFRIRGCTEFGWNMHLLLCFVYARGDASKLKDLSAVAYFSIT